MNDIVKINPSEYGLEESKASQISSMFKPMLDKMVELEKEYNELQALETSQYACKKAKELRLKYVKVRTGTATIHKDLKQFYLQGGRFVDGWKNAQLMASEGVEKNLLRIENHYINIEKQRVAEVRKEREEILLKYGETVFPPGLGEMGDEVWANYHLGVKGAYELRVAAEEKAEKDRVERKRQEEERRNAIFEENARLKKEAEETENILRIENEKRRKAEQELHKKVEQEKLVAEIKVITTSESRTDEVSENEIEKRRKAEQEQKQPDEKIERKYYGASSVWRILGEHENRTMAVKDAAKERQEKAEKGVGFVSYHPHEAALQQRKEDAREILRMVSMHIREEPEGDEYKYGLREDNAALAINLILHVLCNLEPEGHAAFMKNFANKCIELSARTHEEEKIK